MKIYPFPILMIFILFSFLVYCKQSEKSKLNINQNMPAFNENQQRLFDSYIHRLNDFPTIISDPKSEKQLNWKYYRDTPELEKLIKTYNLKNEVDYDNEIETFLNLMDWVHIATQSEGDLGNPDTLNSAAIINYVKTQNRAVNCRMKSIVLNEILLAFGYYSRRISFKPSQFDGDSHSIVTVYSYEMQKWICLDPTFNTYFHDARHNLLSYLEIRQAYTNGDIPSFRSINISPEYPLKLAGIEFSTYDQWYSVYMAKNCFRVSCPQISKFGHENSDDLNYLNLLPYGYIEDRSDSNTISTTNSTEFFKRPF